MILSEIESVEFNLYSTAEIDEYAVVNVTNPEPYGSASVRDLKMGPHNESQPCDTCSSDMRGCPGHYGKIIIPRLMHPLAVNSIILTLSCVCNSCGGLLVNRAEIERAGINRLREEKRLQAIKDLVEKLGRRCKRYEGVPGYRQCEPQPRYHSYREYTKDKFEYRLPYSYAGKAKKTIYFRAPDVPIDSTENSIYKILDAISQEDAITLGFTDTHPRNMIIERMIVIPYCARSDVYQGDKFWPDDLTSMYQDIIKKARIYYDPNISEALKETTIRDLNFNITRFMKNDGSYTQGGVKVYVDVKKRIQGKTAIVRANIMGKRVNFAGRTVVGPGAYLRVDEVGIPRLMAVKLTRPIVVTDYNKEELQAKYDNNKVMHITMYGGHFSGQRVMVNDILRQRYPDYQLNEGDIVERMLEDGDLVLINRQPTLHKQNILACYAKIIDDRVVRINLSVTTPLNADFDGDEINIHVPQTIEAYAEAEQLVSIFRNLMSSEANRPMMGIVYDTLSGAYLITYPEHEFERLSQQIEKLAGDMVRHPAGSDKYHELEAAMNVAVQRREVVKQRILLDPVVYNEAIDPITDSKQYQTLYERLAKYGIDPRSGRGLISAAFPEDFDYQSNDGKGNVVIIKEGILIKGLLTKDTLGTKDGSIIGEMYKQLGGLITVDFMSDIQFVVREFLLQHGLSIGIDDCIPDDPAFRRQVDEALTSASIKVISLAERPVDNPIMAERRERKILETLEKAKTGTEELLMKYFKPDNALLIMAGSGAKGTALNAVQMASALGQQKVSGRRIQAGLPGDRSLPVFEPEDTDPQARGFCFNSFASGLEPSEFFFHAQGGREGLTDTAVNTARTGFLQHQIIKSAEDIHIASDGSVRSADLGAIEFVYGGDGFKADELTTVHIQGEPVPFFRDPHQLAHSINTKYAPRPSV